MSYLRIKLRPHLMLVLIVMVASGALRRRNRRKRQDRWVVQLLVLSCKLASVRQVCRVGRSFCLVPENEFAVVQGLARGEEVCANALTIGEFRLPGQFWQL